MTGTDLCQKLENICNNIDNGKELILEDSILEFQTSVKNIIDKLDGIMQNGRVLRLGIVGEVKAGKSSFLNALLFDGKDILPKAPTPMTAALTRIGYSKKPRARIVFYDVNDWNIIVKKSDKYDEKMHHLYQQYLLKVSENKKVRENKRILDNTINVLTEEEFKKMNRDSISSEYRACKELTEMASVSGINIAEWLGKEKIIENTTQDDYGYLRELNEYVGADGKYTSIVKYTEIQMDNSLLEGIEVIDTPGLNDPILSRSRTTREFLIECDAVFLLGYCGQFLAADDMKLILSSLPNEGINKAVLIGSKMDSAILQYSSQKISFKQAYLGTKANCEKQAKDNIDSCQINSYNEKIIKQIKSSLPPVCVSSLAYSAAMQIKNNENIGELENHIIRNMKRRFSDFVDDERTLMGLSNIPDVRENVFQETKAQKEIIIQERVNEIIENQKGKFLRSLDDIANQARLTLNDLKSYDCEQLKEKLTLLKEKLDSTRIVVRNLFESAAIETRRQIGDLANEVGMELSNHTDIEVITSSKTKHHSSTSGALFWKKEHHWDEIITTHTAEVKDVEENMRKYYFSCMKMINASFRELINIEDLKDNVKATVMGAFDRADKEFDENKIIMPLENALNRIILPEIELIYPKYEKMLDEKIGDIVQNGTVKNENIPMLKRAQESVISEMSRDFIEELKKQGKSIDNNLQIQSGIFVDNIVNQLEENQKKLEELIVDKQTNICKLEEFIRTITESKQLLMED